MTLFLWDSPFLFLVVKVNIGLKFYAVLMKDTMSHNITSELILIQF